MGTKLSNLTKPRLNPLVRERAQFMLTQSLKNVYFCNEKVRRRHSFPNFRQWRTSSFLRALLPHRPTCQSCPTTFAGKTWEENSVKRGFRSPSACAWPPTPTWTTWTTPTRSTSPEQTQVSSSSSTSEWVCLSFIQTASYFIPTPPLDNFAALLGRQLSGPSVFRELEFIQIRSYLVWRHFCFNLFYPHSSTW